MRHNKKKKNIKAVIILFFVASIIIYYYFFIILPVVKTYSSQQIKSSTEKAVNLAVSNVINRTLKYDSLIDITYAKTGEIASFSANQYEINTITREIVKETQYQMNLLGQDGVNLNVGTFSGIPFFIGRGPKIKMHLVPIGVVASNFQSVFDAVGINMTKHSLLLNITVHVSIVMPVQSYDVYSQNQVLLAESIIVGKVPEVYLNGGGLNKS